MKERIFTTIILLVFIVGTNFAQSIDELNSRQNKELENNHLTTDQTKYEKKIDWSIDDDTWGVSYSYSPHFPLSFSVNFTAAHFSIVGEIGVTCTNKNMKLKKIMELCLYYI